VADQQVGTDPGRPADPATGTGGAAVTGTGGAKVTGAGSAAVTGADPGGEPGSGRHRAGPSAGRRLVRRAVDCLVGGYVRPAVLVPVLLVILGLLVTIALTLSVANAVLVAVAGIGLRCYCSGHRPAHPTRS
jgi:hypothetical protein